MKVCRFYLTTGTCRRGTACNYLHTKEEKQHPAMGYGRPVTRSRLQPVYFRTKVCAFWQQGHCQYGDRCTYLHPPGIVPLQNKDGTSTNGNTGPVEQQRTSNTLPDADVAPQSGGQGGQSPQGQQQQGQSQQQTQSSPNGQQQGQQMLQQGSSGQGQGQMPQMMQQPFRAPHGVCNYWARGVHCRYGARCKFRHGPMPQYGQDPRMGYGQPYGFPGQQGSPQGQGQGQQNVHGGVYLNGYNGSGHDGMHSESDSKASSPANGASGSGNYWPQGQDGTGKGDQQSEQELMQQQFGDLHLGQGDSFGWGYSGMPQSAGGQQHQLNGNGDSEHPHGHGGMYAGFPSTTPSVGGGFPLGVFALATNQMQTSTTSSSVSNAGFPSMLSSPAYVNGVNGYTSPTNQANGNGVTTNGASQAPNVNGVASPKPQSNGVSPRSAGKETSTPSTQVAVTAGTKA